MAAPKTGPGPAAAAGRKRSKPQKRTRKSKRRTLAPSPSPSASSPSTAAASTTSSSSSSETGFSRPTETPHGQEPQISAALRARLAQLSSDDESPSGPTAAPRPNPPQPAHTAPQPGLPPTEDTAGGDTVAAADRGLSLDAAFDEWYLRRCTIDFADDLELIRHEPGFRAGRSVAAIVRLFKSGAGAFSREEKRMVMAREEDREGEGRSQEQQEEEIGTG